MSSSSHFLVKNCVGAKDELRAKNVEAYKEDMSRSSTVLLLITFKKMDRNVSVEDEEEWVVVPRNSLVEKMEYMQQ